MNVDGLQPEDRFFLRAARSSAKVSGLFKAFKEEPIASCIVQACATPAAKLEASQAALATSAADPKLRMERIGSISA